MPGPTAPLQASSAQRSPTLYERGLSEMQRRAGIEENLETALQCYPEHFAPIAMLYIPCEINGVKMRAFVDSGAQV